MTSQSINTHGHDVHEHHDTSSMTQFGFWIYLMTDCLLFASVFATYAVLYPNVNGGPSGKDLFDLKYVLAETFALLVSSITYGFAMVCAHKSNRAGVLLWLFVTFLLGATFIGLELNEFHHLIIEGNGPSRSAFLSGFFALVGMHGLHVTVGLFWMIANMVEVARCGLGRRTITRLSCLSLFWHFLDIIWICVFTVVYLMGVL
ncbi:cytochrome o ubiquinol oxidase subunit III [Celerinatantimonas yamalensis]|uniref:Cytochrome bo(3) ubiquinol oxidase subunit 3 n=1 Tax=Celerinatantimonas yamalensis TaxID=559956 RepID=A0ABW9G8F6_9GAMM